MVHQVVDFDPASRIKEAFTANIGFGNVVAPGNQGRVTVTAFDDGVEVDSETFLVRNGTDRSVSSTSEAAFDTLEIAPLPGNGIRFSLTGITKGLAPDSLV